jgi:hypothetical protein
LGAVSFLECGKTQLARVAGEHHPPGNTDDVTGGRIGREIGICGADRRQRVGAPDLDGVRIAALGGQASAFVPADPELLRDVCVAGVHDLPA